MEMDNGVWFAIRINSEDSASEYRHNKDTLTGPFVTVEEFMWFSTTNKLGTRWRLFNPSILGSQINQKRQ